MMNHASSMTRRLIFCALAAAGILSVRADDAVTVTGRVYLDGNGNGKADAGEPGLAGIRVTDSVNFVTTAADGAYTIRVADDPEIPFGAARVVSVSWPTGKWPTGQWWRRLSEVTAGAPVDFGLRADEQKVPFVFAHITDDHGGGGGYGAIGEQLKEQSGGLIRFCINTGDLGYAGPDTADQMFGSVAANAKAFPVPMFFTPGNHDMVGRIPDWGKGDLYGTGGFTKYLGPIRWSFTYGGVHFAGVDWADAKNGEHEGSSEIAAEWLERDLQALPAGTRVLLFMHFPSACARFVEVVSRYKVTQVFGGHNHVFREYALGSAPAITSINLQGKNGLLGVVQEKDFDVVAWCGGCKGKPNYHSKGCALRHFLSTLKAPVEQRATRLPELEKRHGTHAGLADAKVASSTQALDAGQGSVHVVAEIEPGPAGRTGLRIGLTEKIEIVWANGVLQVAGAPVPFVLRPGEKTLSWQVVVERNLLTLYANNLIRLVKPVKVDNPAKVSVFAEGGAATFKKVDAWSLGD